MKFIPRWITYKTTRCGNEYADRGTVVWSSSQEASRYVPTNSATRPKSKSTAISACRLLG